MHLHPAHQHHTGTHPTPPKKWRENRRAKKTRHPHQQILTSGVSSATSGTIFASDIAFFSGSAVADCVKQKGGWPEDKKSSYIQLVRETSTVVHSQHNGLTSIAAVIEGSLKSAS
jgi:hypothetical protein